MKRFATAVVGLLMPAGLFAQALADRMPADACYYVGFKGSAALAAQYQGSNLKPLLEATDLDVLVSERFHQRLGVLITRSDNELGEAWPAIAAAVKQMWRYPTAIAVQPHKDRADFVIKCDVGNDAPALLQQVKAAMPQGSSIQVEQAGSIVMIGSDLASVRQITAAQSLAANPLFAASMKQVDKDAAVVATFNMDALLTAIREEKTDRTAKALGLTGVHMAAYSGNFAGKDWAAHAYIAADADRKGVATLLGTGRPFSDDALKLVPVTAVNVDISQFDLAAATDEVRRVMGQMMPDGERQFDRGIQMLNSLMGMDIRGQLLPALGTEWIYYTDVSIGSTQSLGFVLANRLRDSAKAEAVLQQLQNKVLTYARAGAQSQGMNVPSVERQVGTVKLHVISLPLITPAWTIKDGVLYVGLYPQVVAAAAEFAGSGAPTLAQLPLIRDVKNTGIKAESLSYTDLPRGIENGYAIAMALTRYIGLLDMMGGVETPVMPLPPLPVMRSHVTPTMTVTWSDAAGWHLQGSGPFPGARVLGAMVTADLNTMQVPLMTSIMLPSLARAREKANQVKCASNLRQIGQGALLFASDHKGQYPDTLGEMQAEESMALQTFICPSTSSAVPPDIASGSPETKQQWVDLNSDYIYMGGALKMGGDPELIMAYEKPADHPGEGSNVLFADGHVEFLPQSVLQQRLKRQAAPQQ